MCYNRIPLYVKPRYLALVVFNYM